jgi:hypothetical protein
MLLYTTEMTLLQKIHDYQPKKLYKKQMNQKIDSAKYQAKGKDIHSNRLGLSYTVTIRKYNSKKQGQFKLAK